MKSEPLTKEKISELGLILNGREVEVIKRVDYEDVKSAVQWLLKEIEKEKKKNFELYDKRIGSYVKWNAFVVTMKNIEKLIKKAFSGVVEE